MGLFSVMAQDVATNTIPVRVEVIPLNAAAATCSGQFVRHDLDHVTTVPGGDKVRMFEANGGGVGLHDLDNDDDLDIVLANHAGLNTILWNEGNLTFRTERMAHGESRAVTIVDVDGDSWQDIVFSRTKSAPAYWRNDGTGHFEQEFLEAVGKPLYVINWGDLDDDGDLDLVGATYDASLLADFGREFLASGNGGVYYYENDDSFFRLTSLATRAQALALILVDLNQDNHLDIWVGNDFDVPDQTWYWSEAGWQFVQPFSATSHSTMSLDFGDVNNDGIPELFSTDMRPYADDRKTRAAWYPIIGAQNYRFPPGDPQVAANVLQSIGEFVDIAGLAGVAASGWSWAGKFGDLNQDGWLDLYVVNGFMEETVFFHLPGHELVEENQVFRNIGNRQFVRAPEWGLGSLRSGRGMSMADLDDDGDLDIVVNNLRGAAELFENQLCEGNSLQVDLFWPGSDNHRAIGATLTLHSDDGVYCRDVRTASGYLSGDPARIHFGIPDGAQLEWLDIRWPDGAVSRVAVPPLNVLLKITR